MKISWITRKNVKWFKAAYFIFSVCTQIIAHLPKRPSRWKQQAFSSRNKIAPNGCAWSCVFFFFFHPLSMYWCKIRVSFVCRWLFTYSKKRRFIQKQFYIIKSFMRASAKIIMLIRTFKLLCKKDVINNIPRMPSS